MPLTDKEVFALRKEFDEEFGSGEAEWADTSPEGLLDWNRTHRPLWGRLLDGHEDQPVIFREVYYGAEAVVCESGLRARLAAGGSFQSAGTAQLLQGGLTIKLASAPALQREFEAVLP